MTLWLFNQRVTLSARYCPTWDRPMYYLTDNGGRKPDECLDINLTIWRFAMSLTIWGIGGLSTVLRYMPRLRIGLGTNKE